ncbi:hypothetical protein BDV18DRAFT_167835 [Aspergillus unguis]
MEPKPLRTCMLCRQRKIKCDRQQPCANCARVDARCTYPAGPGRASKRPRKAVETRLLAQLARLESVVKRMEAGGQQGQEPGQTFRNEAFNPSDSSAEIEKGIGRLVVDEHQSCYVSSAPWTQLGDEIEELRDLLHQPADDEETVQAPKSADMGADAVLFGFRAQAHSLEAYHPPLHQAVALFNVFKANVSPLVRVFHLPSLEQIFWDAIASMDVLDKNVEALLFAIYYSAVTSLDADECLRIVGQPKSKTLEIYRFGVEQSLARAGLLNTQNLILLQATVLFLTALRNEDDSRTVWSLTALVYHIAQAMGLHRDGEAFGLRPLETELRRRLWWHICLLDNRSTDYHGSEPIVHEEIFDTKVPLNINDGDISAEMIHPPPEREGATEMTFCLIRCEAMWAVWKVGYMAPRNKAQSGNGQESAAREALAEDLERRLQDKYLKYCDPAVPILRACMAVAKIITMRMWMYILSARSKTERSIRDRLFKESVEVLKLSTALLKAEDIRGWAWHSRTHAQWYSVAFILAELCWRPASQECDDAWEAASTVHDMWNDLGGEKRGNLWRPIQRLMARARYVREMQKTDSRLVSPGLGNQPSKDAGESLPSGPGIEMPLCAPMLASQENIYPPETHDPLMAMFGSSMTGPYGSSMDIFGMLGQTGSLGYSGL